MSTWSAGEKSPLDRPNDFEYFVLRFPVYELTSYVDLTQMLSADLPRVVINGIYSSGRNYFVELLHELLRDVFLIKDGFPNPDEEIPRGVIRHNHMVSGYIGCWYNLDTYEHLFYGTHKREYRSILIYRDPRDIFVSSLNYFNTTVLQAQHTPSQIRPLDFLHNGVNGHFPPWKVFIQCVKDLVQREDSFHVRYEDLARSPETVLQHTLLYLGTPLRYEKIVEVAKQVVRRGMIGQWCHYFDAEIESTFKELSGDIVSFLRYEEDENWSYKSEASNPETALGNTVNFRFVSREMLRWCYRIFFEREPESEAVIENHLENWKRATVGELRRAFLNSKEYTSGFANSDKSTK